jgi:hypothetical protein
MWSSFFLEPLAFFELPILMCLRLPFFFSSFLLETQVTTVHLRVSSRVLLIPVSQCICRWNPRSYMKSRDKRQCGSQSWSWMRFGRRRKEIWDCKSNIIHCLLPLLTFPATFFLWSAMRGSRESHLTLRVLYFPSSSQHKLSTSRLMLLKEKRMRWWSFLLWSLLSLSLAEHSFRKSMSLSMHKTWSFFIQYRRSHPFSFSRDQMLIRKALMR